ncbi:MAG: hypothetical protein ACLRXC_12575, partial [[Clostridium] leptum]
DPNADAVLDAFSRAVYACGIPERVLLDNGADYTVHDLFNKDFALSLANEMCMEVTNATPYNAKAKLIERFFNTLEYSYCIHLPSYFGADPQRRPERMKKASDQLKDVAMPFDEFAAYLENVIGQYNNTVHTGDSMDGKRPAKHSKTSLSGLSRLRTHLAFHVLQAHIPTCHRGPQRGTGSRFAAVLRCGGAISVSGQENLCPLQHGRCTASLLLYRKR